MHSDEYKYAYKYDMNYAYTYDMHCNECIFIKSLIFIKLYVRKSILGSRSPLDVREGKMENCRQRRLEKCSQ